jgi:hypothetical protein
LARKYTYDELKDCFDKEGCRLLSKTYESVTATLIFIAVCGHEHKSSFTNFNSGKNRLCPECRRKEITKKQSLSYAEVEKIFKDNGCILLSETYENSKEKLHFLCKCGKGDFKSLDKFKRKSMCKYCGREDRDSKRRLPIEQVRKIVESYGCELLSTEYKNTKDTLLFKCKCGEPFSANLDSFKISGQCKFCSYKSSAIQRSKLTYKELVEVFKREGCTLLTKGHCTTSTKVSFTCSCGGEGETRLHLFLSGSRCRKCNASKISGANNYQWRYDKTDEERIRQRKFKEYADWRKNVFARDSYTCISCGQYGGGLAAHHLDGWHWCTEKRLDINNGVTLCNECHDSFHEEYGKRDNTKEQFDAWILNRRK